MRQGRSMAAIPIIFAGGSASYAFRSVSGRSPGKDGYLSIQGVGCECLFALLRNILFSSVIMGSFSWAASSKPADTPAPRILLKDFSSGLNNPIAIALEERTSNFMYLFTAGSASFSLSAIERYPMKFSIVWCFGDKGPRAVVLLATQPAVIAEEISPFWISVHGPDKTNSWSSADWAGCSEPRTLIRFFTAIACAWIAADMSKEVPSNDVCCCLTSFEMWLTSSFTCWKRLVMCCDRNIRSPEGSASASHVFIANSAIDATYSHLHMQTVFASQCSATQPLRTSWTVMNIVNCSAVACLSGEVERTRLIPTHACPNCTPVQLQQPRIFTAWVAVRLYIVFSHAEISEMLIIHHWQKKSLTGIMNICACFLNHHSFPD